MFYLDSINFQSALLACSMSCPACCLFLMLGSFPKEYVVYKGIFQQGQEHKHKASHQINIYCLDIGNLWQGLPEVGADGGHGQHSCDSCKRKKRTLTNETGKEMCERHNGSIAQLPCTSHADWLNYVIRFLTAFCRTRKEDFLVGLRISSFLGFPCNRG